MARKTNDSGVSDSGANNMTDELRREFYTKALHAQQEIDRLAELMKSAKSSISAVYKDAEKSGVSKKAIQDVLRMRNVDLDILRVQERERARMLAVSGVWPSIQEDFFDRLTPPADLTQEVTLEVAYDNGHTCGVKGENRDINPHAPGTERWEAWDRGWLIGQAKNAPNQAPANDTSVPETKAERDKRVKREKRAAEKGQKEGALQEAQETFDQEQAHPEPMFE